MYKFIAAFIALFLMSCDGVHTSYSYNPTPTTTVRNIPTQTYFAREQLSYTTKQYYVPYYASRHYPPYISYSRRTYCPPTYRYTPRTSHSVRARPSNYKRGK